MAYKGKQYIAQLCGGAGTADAFAQYSDTAAHTDKFYGFMPVGGNATFTALLEDAVSVGATKLAYTYYEGVYYPGSFTGCTLATGSIIVLKDKSY
jgi:hypothetical protein